MIILHEHYCLIIIVIELYKYVWKYLIETDESD